MTKDEAPTSPKDAALKLALEALEACIDYIAPYTHHIQGEEDADTAEEAITAIKEALAQPEQEPKTYALLYPQADYVATPDERPWGKPWVSLTKEEINSALSKYQNWYDFAAHLENILKEKNQ